MALPSRTIARPLCLQIAAAPLLWACVFMAAVLFFPQTARASMLPGADMAIGQKKQTAITQFQSGHYAQAYDTFMQLLREVPDDDDVNMGIAVSAYKLKNYPQSLMAYERLIAKYQKDARLRVQVARVYVALGEPESARLELRKAKEFNPVITDKEIEDVVTALSASATRWQHQGRLSAGVLYDSNANQGPRSNTMNLGSFNNLFVDGAKKKASWGNYLSASFEGGYRLGDESPWWVMGDVLGYQRWNTSAGVRSNNNFGYGRAALGLRYIGAKALVDLRMKGDAANQHHKEGEDQDIHSFGPELTLVLVPHKNFQLISRGAIEDRTYTVTDMRDGSYWTVSQFARVLFGERNHELLAGVTLQGNEPDVRAYKYLAVEPMVRLVLKFPYDVSFSPFVAFREENYKGPATGLETRDRRDKQWKSGASLAWDITDYLTIDATYQYINNNSNSALYEYTQHYSSMGITVKF
ncbi:MAG: hypothetical protein DELT_01838 [Desulfovibrio sp.]